MIRGLLQGIARVKSSSDVVGAVMKELRLQGGQPDSDVRLAVAVDGVNALWGKTTIKKADKSPVRKQHSPVLPRIHPHVLPTVKKSCVSLCLIRWKQRSSLWFIT